LISKGRENFEFLKSDIQMKKNAIEEEKILKQIDKTYILCIDPETRLPFMINMGMKLADICDLDNRPFHAKQAEINRMSKFVD
jgi:hypothetical protein